MKFSSELDYEFRDCTLGTPDAGTGPRHWDQKPLKHIKI